MLFILTLVPQDACGAHLNVNGEQMCHKQWDVHECGMSSTWRELTAIVFALQSFLPLLKGSYIKWFSDSQNACRIIQVGSMRKGLHVIAWLKIFQFCVDNGIELEMQWIPRTKLDRADFLNIFCNVSLMTMEYVFNGRSTLSMLADMMNP